MRKRGNRDATQRVHVDFLDPGAFDRVAEEVTASICYLRGPEEI